MNTDFFSKVRILDGGMGQELLAHGLKPKGSLWSCTALIDITIKTANGRVTCAEALGHKEFVITKLYRSA